MTFLLAEKILLIAGLMAIIFIGSELLTRVALLVKRLVQKRVRKQTEEELLYKAKVQASVRKWLVTRKSYSWLLTGFYLVFLVIISWAFWYFSTLPFWGYLILVLFSLQQPLYLIPTTISLQKLPQYSPGLKKIEQQPLILRLTDYVCLCNLLPLGLLMLTATVYLDLNAISILAICEIIIGLIFSLLLFRRVRTFWHYYRTVGAEYLVKYRHYLGANLVTWTLFYMVLGLIVYYLNVWRLSLTKDLSLVSECIKWAMK